MADAPRARRLAKRIMTIVATELEHQVKDPRLAMVTVTATTVTADLRDAVVYYTVYGDETAVAGTAAALASANGVLRSAVGRQTGIKFTPTLTFRPDTIPEHSRHIEQLLVAARESDAQVAERAAGARYAGEPDPYRQPRAPDDGDQPDEGGTSAAVGDGVVGDGDSDGGVGDGDAGDGAASAAAGGGRTTQDAGDGFPADGFPADGGPAGTGER